MDGKPTPLKTLPLADALQMAGDLHRQGDFVGARSLYEQIVRAFPTHADVLHQTGIVAYQQGDCSAAINYLRRAIASAPSPAMHGNLGAVLQSTGALQEAIDCYRLAVSLDPALADAHNNLGVALHLGDDIPGSIDSFRRALAIHPDFSQAHNNLGNALHAAGDFLQAIECFRQAIALNPGYAHAQNNMAHYERATF